MMGLKRVFKFIGNIFIREGQKTERLVQEGDAKRTANEIRAMKKSPGFMWLRDAFKDIEREAVAALRSANPNNPAEVAICQSYASWCDSLDLITDKLSSEVIINDMKMELDSIREKVTQAKSTSQKHI